jgi:hypothetical protein
MVVGEAAAATVVAIRAVVGVEVVMAAAGDADEVDVVAVVVVGVAVAAGEIAAIRAGALVAVRRW